MKKIFLLFVISIVSIVPPVFAQQTKQLVIYHTNDTHSCIMPLNSNLTDTLLAGRAGFLRRISFFNRERAANPDMLLFDSGDFSQGSTYYTLYKGDVEVGLMNMMHYDAATIGNHEFDFGVENMARLFKMAEFPIVCANYDFTGTPLEGLVKPYVILERNGLKVGVFGLSPILDGLVFAGNFTGVKYEDPVSSAQKVASYLKNEAKCDVVICLSHLGWSEKGMDDQVLVSKTRDIDLILGGHSHTYFKELRYVKNLDGKEIPNDQNGKNGIYIGKLLLNFEETHSK
jgi:5'-nucleotidase